MYSGQVKGSYGSGHRSFGHGKGGRKKDWNEYPLTGTARGDADAKKAFRRDAESRLFIIV